MPKIMTIIGTRPELIKMSRVIAKLDELVDHILVHTGQNYDYELNQVFFDNLKIRKPNYFLNVNSKNSAQTIGKIISNSDKVFDKEKPDAVLLYGDTNSCLSVISAKKRKIPIFHMEAGNRCFDQRVPEETNRKIVDHLSDINMVLTENARLYLINEGIKPETIIKTGSHMFEVLEYYKKNIESSDILEKLKLHSKKYFIVSAHREENVDDKNILNELSKTLETIANKYGFPIIFSFHLRTLMQIKKYKITFSHKLIIFSKPFGFFDYVKLQSKAMCVLSDSGTLTEESSILNFRAISIRDQHERPEGMDAGTLLMSKINCKSIMEAIQFILKTNDSPSNLILDYKYENVSNKVVNIVLSYIDYINRTVWFK